MIRKKNMVMPMINARYGSLLLEDFLNCALQKQKTAEKKNRKRKEYDVILCYI